jgi:hypothetical protein
MSVARQLELRE